MPNLIMLSMHPILYSALKSINRNCRWAIWLLVLPALICTPAFSHSQEPQPGHTDTDWLIDPSSYVAQIYEDTARNELIFSNGLITRTFRLSPNGATVGLTNLVTDESVIRGVKPEAIVMIDSVHYPVGGLTGQPNYAYLQADWINELRADSAAFHLSTYETGPIEASFPWKKVRHHDASLAWPPKGIAIRMDYLPPKHAINLDGITISVHYELFDGIPAFSKWISVHNNSNVPINLDSFSSEVLAAVEPASWVETRGIRQPTPNIHVETDFSFGGMRHENANRHAVHWVEDPAYTTQVNYLRTTPAILEVRPTFGPNQTILPGETFESFRAYVLIYDSTERERKGLSRRRLYRTIAPWVTENPIMMHVRFSDWESVKKAIDQAADVGFEMVILTFGSGFNIENQDPAYRAEMERFARYARSKGVELGGYSLLSSRHIEPEEDNSINPATGLPGGKIHGFSPALASPWGQAYFENLYEFYRNSGFTLLEHDGPYPGDVDAAARPPLQKGVHDSRWVQWKITSDFYKWCRAQGIYLNVPDWYFLVGSSKVAMGYRETNWSLPRAQQVIHARQNIYDGTWGKTPSMGWMFVPLTEYHGGGEAATIEPLDTHLAHYEQMLTNNLASGVQAAYRGPRLYDTPRTRAMVARWVGWYKRYRAILESDLIHGRRADGRDLDWMLHVNPSLKEKGMLVVFNPLQEEVTKSITVPLYYTGLTETASVRHEGGIAEGKALNRDFSIDIEVTVPGKSFTWYVIEDAD